MIGVYVANISKNCDSCGIYPDERAKAIEKVKNPQLKIQKINSWKLLEKAVRDSFGYELNELDFTLNDSGKWTCDKLYFSLSHTSEQVAAAVSDKPVGVDIESYFSFERRHSQRLADRILCGEERAADSSELARLWTAKESIFKCVGGKTFSPDKICVENFPVRSFDDGDYCISVCGSFDGGDSALTIKRMIL